VRHSRRRDLRIARIGTLQTLDKEFEVVIAGGGIASLTAALVSARLGRKTLVLAGDVLGGLLSSIEKIEGFPGYPDGIPGYELCPIIHEQAVAAGVEFAMTDLQHLEAQGDRWYAETGEGDVQTHALILATGSTLKQLGVPGEGRLRGKGVSYCASCDAPLLRNCTVAVVGGGDSALQESLTLAEFAKRVIVLARGEKLSAQMVYRNRVTAHPKIEIRFRTVVEQILGANKVTGARICGTAGDAAADLELAALFVYIGLEPNTAFLKALIRLDPSGRIPADDQMRTELRGVFAAGVVRSGSAGRAVASAGDGTTAAVAADRFLAGGDW
jgi:thioredoxin reductase (NADPH)